MRRHRPPDLHRDAIVAALVGTLVLIVICPALGLIVALGL
jgi:hypothetical protein